MIITIANNKGGAGKTTLARALIAAWQGQKQPLAVVDCDRGKALHRWCSTIYEGDALGDLIAESDANRLPELLENLALKHRRVLVDTPGFADQVAGMTLSAADCVIVPCMTSEADLVDAALTVQRVQATARAARREIPTRIVMTRMQNNTVAKHAVAQLDAMGLRRFETTISSRVAFAGLSHSGVLADPKAKAEVDALMAEMKKEKFW